jgi:hypothetical protein
MQYLSLMLKAAAVTVAVLGSAAILNATVREVRCTIPSHTAREFAWTAYNCRVLP